ncbi:G-protein coupled receptor 35-like [Amblyraja radiata]|uniref:G-protein coupled receptor 35-like n=1 Tax=Amblyraja radiata TaxID=386614 RepID=UPI0014040973|nr:G-protein coupled receptor 35-like [Amblyraja radiata]
MALYTICCEVKKPTKSFIYVMNLVVSDSLLLFALPFKVYAFFVNNDWSRKMGKNFCRVLESLCFVNTYTSILVITLICVDRYVAVVHPFNARTISSPRTIAGVCAAIWIIVCSCTLHIYFTSQSESCFYHLSPRVLDIVFIAPLGVVFVVCALIMVLCSIGIVHSLRDRASDPRDRGNEKCTKVLLSNLFTFLICFTPYHAALLLYASAVNGFISEQYYECLRHALHFTLYLANVNCCLDSIYYFYAIKELRRAERVSGTAVPMEVADTSMGSTVNELRDPSSH